MEHYLEEAGKIFPFEKVEQQIRKGKNNIEKRHYKYYYDSPVKGQTPFYILLDILFEENHYSKVIRKPIRNELLITEEPYYEVSLPSVDCILGDKLTAFAPHATGIPFGVDKELEIIKQMYDSASLTDVTEHFSAEKAAVMACKVMHMTACVLKNVPYEQINDWSKYIKTDIGFSKYKNLSKLRKFNPEGFAHIVKAIELL